MASTYSPNLRIELIGNGEQSNTWGATTNTNLGTLIEQAISGLVSVDVTAGNVTLTSLNGASDQSRQMIIVATGTPGVTRTITAPAVNKVYIVYNNSNADLSFIASGGTGVSLSVGAKKLIYCDGTNFVEAINSVAITSGSINGTTIGATTASTGAFTTLSASSTVSGTGFSTYLASPPAIGGTTAAAGKFTTLEYTGALTGSTGILNIGSGQVYKDASGNVGIGTSSPSSKLSFGANIGNDFAIFENSGGSNKYGIGMSGAGTAPDPYRTKLYANGSEYLSITSSGNVGIGTSSPTNKLDVVGDGIFIAQRGNTTAQVSGGVWSMASTFWSTPTYTGVGILQNGSTATGTTLGLANANLGQLIFQNGSAGLIYNNTGNPIVFGTSSLERMRIDSSGNVGIGTTSLPIAGTKVGISGVSAIATGLLSYVNTGSATKKWSEGPDSVGNFVIFNDASAGAYISYGGTSWTAYSDERLKTDLIPIENGLEKVNSLRSVTGRYLTDEEGKSRSFLIAQDVQKVLPEAVSVQDDELGTLGVAYTEVIPLLVASIKELKAIIDTQQEQINSLLGK